jgi:hypothetical protein
MLVREEIARRLFVKRWLDDLWIVRCGGITRAVSEFIQVLESPTFYGPTLILKKVVEPEPFGFMAYFWEQHGRRVLLMRSRLPFVEERRGRVGPGWMKVRSTICGSAQFRAPRVESAVATGYVARYLDMSSEPEHLMLLGLSRVISELRMVGMDARTVKKAVSKYAYGVNAALRPALAATNWSLAECEAFSSSFDLVDARLRSEAADRMKAVPCGSRYR